MDPLYAAVNLLLVLVVALVLAVGIVLTLRARPQHGRAAVLGTWGCVVLLIGLVANVVTSYLLPTFAAEGGAGSFMLFALVQSGLNTLFTATGTALLVWAVIARRPGRPRQPPAWNPGQPPPAG